MKQIIISIFFLFFLAFSNTTPIPASESSIIGRPAPDFTLLDLNGKEVSLLDFKGKVVIIDFWATWCPPCVKEIPHFIELYEEYKDKGLAMVGISLDRQGVGVVKAFKKQFKVNYPLLMANNQVVSAYGNIRGIPTTFVIDSEGNIQRMYVGYQSKSVFEADIKKLLPDVKSDGTEEKEVETIPNKYVTELNKIGTAGRPESDNAASYYQQAIELYVEEPKGLKVSTWAWPKELPTQQQVMLKKWVQDNNSALEQLQLASRKRYCWFKYSSETLNAIETPHVKKIRQLAIALQARAMLSAENGNTTSALNDIDTLYTVGSQLSVGPKLLVEKLVGIALESFSNIALFNILDRKILDVASMKNLENRFRRLFEDYDEPFDIRSEKLFLQEQVETNPRFSSFKPQLKSTLEFYDKTAAKTPMQLRNEPTEPTNKDNPLLNTAPIARVIEVDFRSKAGLQALITTLAILRYNSDKNGYPATLSQLILAGYLKEMPIDPYSGKPFVYKRTPEGFTLYSFGADFDDDGGQYSKWGAGEKGGDQVFWPVEKRP